MQEPARGIGIPHISRRFFDSLSRLLALKREAERTRIEALAEGMSLQQRAEQGLSFLDLESIEEGHL